MDRKRTASIALIVVLLACTIAIIAFVMGNGSTPIGPPTPIPGGGGLSSIIGEDDLTPVSTFTTLNAGVGLDGVGSGSRFTLNVITPTPQPTATPGSASGIDYGAGLPIPDGSTVADTVYIGVPGHTWNGTGGGAFVVVNDIYYEPFSVTESVTVNQLSFLVISAGNLGDACRIGIYEADSVFQPTDLVVDAGQVVNDTTGWKNAVVNVVLIPGDYVNAMICNSGPAIGDNSASASHSMMISDATTSGTRFPRYLRDNAPAGTPYASGFANPSDSLWQTVDLSNGTHAHFVIMRWSVN